MRQAPPSMHPRRLAVLGLLLGLPATSCEPPPRPVIGVSTSTRFVDAARLALSDAASGGALPVDTVLIPEGTNEAASAIRSAERLVAVPGMVAVVGHSNSAASLAASQIYGLHEVVQIAATSTATIYSRAGPWSFRLVPPDNVQARFLADQVGELLPEGGQVAVLYVNDDYGRGLLAEVTATLDPATHPTALVRPHTEEEGLRPEVVESTIASVAEAAPDLVLWLGRASVLNVYLVPLREALPDPPVLASDGVAAAPQMPNGDGRWNGVRYVDFVDVDATPALRDFARRYRERFGGVATGPDALNYDATALLLEAVAEGARTPDEVRAWLVSLGRERPAFEGITGPIAFDAEGDVERSHVLLRIGGGGP